MSTFNAEEKHRASTSSFSCRSWFGCFPVGLLGVPLFGPLLQKGRLTGNTSPHIIGSPSMIKADDCPNGLQEVAVFVPLWGVAVGILTIGILVPHEHDLYLR